MHETQEEIEESMEFTRTRAILQAFSELCLVLSSVSY